MSKVISQSDLDTFDYKSRQRGKFCSYSSDDEFFELLTTVKTAITDVKTMFDVAGGSMLLELSAWSVVPTYGDLFEERKDALVTSELKGMTIKGLKKVHRFDLLRISKTLLVGKNIEKDVDKEEKMMFEQLKNIIMEVKEKYNFRYSAYHGAEYWKNNPVALYMYNPYFINVLSQHAEKVDKD